VAVEIYIVDAFTFRPFSGNPAAVCFLPQDFDPVVMQKIAQEMNLSETAFVTSTDIPGSYHLRWFTPLAEVKLCGHATLASAHILWATERVARDIPITFQTLSGDLAAKSDESRVITLDFPAKHCYDYAPPMELLVALRVNPISVQRNDMDVLIELESEEDICKVSPDFNALGDIEDIRGVIVTSKANDNSNSYDFVSRFFAPAVGVNEDPVTGSAHCALAPYWSKRLGKTYMIGRQMSKRGGEVGVEWKGDRVELIGKAVTMMIGSFLKV
jgi:PhzF family phenazine biosynthesis protein